MKHLILPAVLLVNFLSGMTAVSAATLKTAKVQQPSDVQETEEKPIRKIYVENGLETVVRISKGIKTSIYLTLPINPKHIALGDDKAIAIEFKSENQINLEALTDKIGYSTNLNIVTQQGHTIIFNLITTEKKSAEKFVQVVFNKGEMTTLPSNTKEAIDTKVICEQIVEESQKQSETKLLNAMIRSVSLKEVDKRDIDDAGEGVILKVYKLLKIGDTAYVVFAIHNRTRVSWIPSDFKVWIANDKIVKEVQSQSQFKKASLGVDEEDYGIATFMLYDIPSKAKFSFQATEKNGTRHPKVDGVRW